MRVDFFKADCQRKTSEKRFGLVDTEDNTPVTINLNDESVWNATVFNSESKEILFTAIDNCINITNEDGRIVKRCDCMMAYDSTLMFIELKNKRDSWQAEGLAQIEATMERMKEENELYFFNFKKRLAIVANSKHQFPCFQEVNLEQREYFKRNFKAWIQFDAKIIIK